MTIDHHGACPDPGQVHPATPTNHARAAGCLSTCHRDLPPCQTRRARAPAVENTPGAGLVRSCRGRCTAVYAHEERVEVADRRPLDVLAADKVRARRAAIALRQAARMGSRTFKVISTPREVAMRHSARTRAAETRCAAGTQQHVAPGGPALERAARRSPSTRHACDSHGFSRIVAVHTWAVAHTRDAARAPFLLPTQHPDAYTPLSFTPGTSLASCS